MSLVETKPHYALLDGLRGVAALLVVWYHIFEGYQFASGAPVITVVNHGYLAVDFFFMLSGFVIGYAYDNRWTGTFTLSQFVKRRLIRLQPMLIMGSLIGFLSFALSGFERWDNSISTLSSSLLALLAGCFLLPALPRMPREVRGNGEMFPLNGPCWSLFFEYIGNLIYALLLRRLTNRQLMLFCCSISLGFAFFALVELSDSGSLGIGWTLDTLNGFGGLFRMLCPFTIGLFLSRIFKPFKVKAIFWISTFLLLLLFHIPYLGNEGRVSLNVVFELFTIFFIFPIIVWLSASGEVTDSVSRSDCCFLGNLSYPLYIVHYPLMYLFYRFMIQTQLYTFSSTWFLALLVFLSSILLAYACLKLYDQPLRKWLSRKYL